VKKEVKRWKQHDGERVGSWQPGARMEGNDSGPKGQSGSLMEASGMRESAPFPPSTTL